MEAASGMAATPAREKRSLDPGNSEEGQPDRKRPALARYFSSYVSSSSLRAWLEVLDILYLLALFLFESI